MYYQDKLNLSLNWSLSSLAKDKQVSLLIYNKYDLFLPCLFLELLACS